MRPKRHALLGQFAQTSERHDLKPTGIGEDRPVPVHELVQAAQPLDPRRRGAQH